MIKNIKKNIYFIVVANKVKKFSNYLRRLRRSALVGRSRPTFCLSICLSVCLFVCPQHNSKTNDPKVFKLYRE